MYRKRYRKFNKWKRPWKRRRKYRKKKNSLSKRVSRLEKSIERKYEDFSLASNLLATWTYNSFGYMACSTGGSDRIGLRIAPQNYNWKIKIDKDTTTAGTAVRVVFVWLDNNGDSAIAGTEIFTTNDIYGDYLRAEDRNYKFQILSDKVYKIPTTMKNIYLRGKLNLKGRQTVFGSTGSTVAAIHKGALFIYHCRGSDFTGTPVITQKMRLTYTDA